MNTILLVLIILMFLIVGCATIFLMFTRAGKNIVVQILHNKKYVICHLRKEASEFEEIWKVVPKPDYLTNVGKFAYDLNPNYTVLKWKKRLHFVLREGDVIPQYLHRTNSNEEILFQVQEVRTALHNTAYDFLYKKNKNIAMLIAFAALFLVIIVAVVCAYEISKIDSTLQTFISIQNAMKVKVGG